jgi:hypothetical protein
MSGHDPFDALSVTDPRPENDPARDDAMLARIVATPLTPGRRHLSQNQRIAIAVATPLVLAGAGFTYAQILTTDVDDAGLRALVLEARHDVPLPPGATWSRLPSEIMGPDTRTDGPQQAQNMALMEAECHWERYWVDSLDNPTALAAAKRGYGQLVGRMRAEGRPLSEVVAWDEKALSAASAGDSSLFRRDLAVNCTPAQGGSATDISSVELSLRESGQPAVALLIARSNPNTLPAPEGAEQSNFMALVSEINTSLRRAGAGPKSDNVYATEYGREYLTVRFFVSDLGRAVPVTRRLAEADQPYAGSFLIVWDGAKMRRIPL